MLSTNSLPNRQPTELIGEVRMWPMGSGQGSTELSPAVAAYVLEQIEEWLRSHPGENASSLAKRAGVSKAQISDVRKTARGVGLKTAMGMARVLGISNEELERRANEAWRERGEHPASRREPLDTAPINANLPGWKEGEKAAMQAGIPAWAIAQASRRSGLAPVSGVTLQYVIDESMEVWRYASPAENIARTNAELDARVLQLRTRADNKLARERGEHPPKKRDR